jgi:parvulin-like peptidyl-prolyl isomerase
VHRGLLVPHVESVLFALPEGGVAGPVESEFGFHLLRREALVEVHLGEVLVQWAGLPRTRATRGRDEARALAEELRARLIAGEALAEVARAASDGPTGPWGGDLGWFTRGSLKPELEGPAFALQPGAVSEVLESPAGFHVLVHIEGGAPPSGG